MPRLGIRRKLTSSGNGWSCQDESHAVVERLMACFFDNGQTANSIKSAKKRCRGLWYGIDFLVLCGEVDQMAGIDSDAAYCYQIRNRIL